VKETLEARFSELLDLYKIPYEQEGTRVRYGGKASKGKYDFETPTHVIECKQIENLNNLTIPGMNRKTHREVLYPKVKSHQIRALRESEKIGGLLVHVTSTDCLYWVSMDVYEGIVIKYRPRTLNNYIDNCIIDLETFVKEKLQ